MAVDAGDSFVLPARVPSTRVMQQWWRAHQQPGRTKTWSRLTLKNEHNDGHDSVHVVMPSVAVRNLLRSPHVSVVRCRHRQAQPHIEVKLK